MPTNNRNTQHDKPRDEFKNFSGETIPPFGVLKITETGFQQEFMAEKPDGDESGCTFALNLGRFVGDDKTATLRTDFYGLWALYDDDGGADPIPGEEWGPTTDWELHRTGSGFQIVGGAHAFTINSVERKAVRVKPAGGGSGTYWGEVTVAFEAAVNWTTPKTGTVQLKNSSDGTDRGAPVSGVLSWWPLAFGVGSIVRVNMKKTPPELEEGTCVPTP